LTRSNYVGHVRRKIVFILAMCTLYITKTYIVSILPISRHEHLPHNIA